jgi:hypothetical protein
MVTMTKGIYNIPFGTTAPLGYHVFKYHGITMYHTHTSGYLPLTAQKGTVTYQRRPLVSEGVPLAEQCTGPTYDCRPLGKISNTNCKE